MPAEILTKKRLIQLIAVLCVLLSAFFYRTYHYTPPAQHTEVAKNTTK